MESIGTIFSILSRLIYLLSKGLMTCRTSTAVTGVILVQGTLPRNSPQVSNTALKVTDK